MVTDSQGIQLFRVFFVCYIFWFSHLGQQIKNKDIDTHMQNLYILHNSVFNVGWQHVTTQSSTINLTYQSYHIKFNYH